MHNSEFHCTVNKHFTSLAAKNDETNH